MSNKSLKRSFISSSTNKDNIPKKLQKLNSENVRLIVIKKQPEPLDEKALFNFQQIQKICFQGIQERIEKLREEYENILKTKLAEQYDTFVKFTFDQIRKHNEDDVKSSYLS